MGGVTIYVCLYIHTAKISVYNTMRCINSVCSSIVGCSGSSMLRFVVGWRVVVCVCVCSD